MRELIKIQKSYKPDKQTLFQLYRRSSITKKELSYIEFGKAIDKTTLIVAKNEKNKIVGFSAYYHNWGFIYLLYVDPNYQNHGIGNSLIKKIIQLRRHNRYGHTIRLLCAIENKSAQKFYQHFGFKNKETVKGNMSDCVLFMYNPNEEL
jgi:ribosomal protein S18 acetylase RimI-like enzyme